MRMWGSTRLNTAVHFQRVCACLRVREHCWPRCWTWRGSWRVCWSWSWVLVARFSKTTENSQNLVKHIHMMTHKLTLEEQCYIAFTSDAHDQTDTKIKATQWIVFLRTWSSGGVGTRLQVESVPALVTIGGRESHVLKVLTVVKQSLERWKTHHRHTRHLIMDTWVLHEGRVNVREGAEGWVHKVIISKGNQ